MSIACIIFSKDRASQLHLLLQSLQKNSNGLFKDLSVIYTASTDQFAEGYDKLRKHFYDTKGLDFVSESQYGGFRSCLLNEVKVVQGNGNEHLCFFTDDDIFYRKLEKVNKRNLLFAVENALAKNETDALCYSLRLGSNVFIQDQYTRETNTNLPCVIQNQTIGWNWASMARNDNFTYPMSVDGHIFRADKIRGFLPFLNFDNPNSLEAEMGNNCHEFVKYPTMLSNYVSLIVNTPLNRVQSTCENKAGEFHGVSPEQLNEWYLKDVILNLDDVDNVEVIGCHQEIAMRVKNI